MRPPLHRLLAAAVVAAFAGCGACQSPVDDPDSSVPGQCQSEAPVIEPQKVDILFVIDNSNSMLEEQEAVASELVAFIEEVRRGGGVAQDFHVGVITTSVYQHRLDNGVSSFRDFPTQSGRLQAVPNALGDGGVVLGSGTERILNGEDPDLISKLSRLVRVGNSGSGQETPFEAVRLALASGLATSTEPGVGNAGFLRDRARLLVVVLSDEDDCSETARPPVVYVSTNTRVDYCREQGGSLTPVSEYHRIFTDEMKDSTGAAREVVWATIGPVGRATKEAQSILDGNQVRNADCPTSNEPGFRHRQMAELFDTSLANLDSICKPSFRQTLINIAGLVNVSQTLEVKNVPDPRLLQVQLTRKDDSTVLCTLGNGGLTNYDPPVDGQLGRVHFGGECTRRANDKGVQIKLLCAS